MVDRKNRHDGLAAALAQASDGRQDPLNELADLIDRPNWYDNVPEPVDANGHEVPLDTRELLLDGKRSSVMCYLYGPTTRKWYVEFAGVDEQRHLNSCTLPDSWERLEKDAAKDPCVYFGCGDDSIYNKCTSCPAYGDDCGPAMAQDVVRRAKALAGVTE